MEDIFDIKKEMKIEIGETKVQIPHIGSENMLLEENVLKAACKREEKHDFTFVDVNNIKREIDIEEPEETNYKEVGLPSSSIKQEMLVDEDEYDRTNQHTQDTEHTNSDSDASEELPLKGNNYESKKSTIEDHQHRHGIENDIEMYECTTCNKKFIEQLKLKAHNLTHNEYSTGEESYECKLCNKQFHRKRNLSRHMIIHTGEKPYVCNLCGKQYMRKQNLNHHLMTHTGEKPHECKICDKKFVAKEKLSCHMKIHTDYKPHECNLCNKQFITKQHLTLHMMTHTGQKPHVCNICGKQFIQKSNLTGHMLTHTGEKRYKCNLCGRQFASNGNLTRHMLTHTGKKPHECKLCEKRFIQKQHLTDHLLTHTENLQKSHLCGEKFTQNVLSRHMMIHTDEKPQIL